MMKVGVPSAALVTAVAVLLVLPPSGNSQTLDVGLPLLVNQLVSLFQSEEIQFMSFQCYYNRYPRIKNWEIYYLGTFTCPAWAAIRGVAETRSRSEVMRKTIENFLDKIRAANLVTEEEVRAWLAG